MDTAQWPQEIVMKTVEDMMPKLICTTSKSSPSSSLERKMKTQKVQPLNCPRCNSSNTKFCYYNNYSLTQPRYFCKTCRRYWTVGGTLRNIPVGGVSRKNRTPPQSNSSSSSKNFPHLLSSSQNTRINDRSNKTHDLNLGFNPISQGFRSFSEFLQVPLLPSSSTHNSSHFSALEVLGGLTSRGLNSLAPDIIGDSNVVYSSSVFHNLSEFKQSLSFSEDEINGSYGGQDNTNGSILFPFEDLKVKLPSNTTNKVDLNVNNKGNGNSSRYWNGMLSKDHGKHNDRCDNLKFD